MPRITSGTRHCSPKHSIQRFCVLLLVFFSWSLVTFALCVNMVLLITIPHLLIPACHLSLPSISMKHFTFFFLLLSHVPLFSHSFSFSASFPPSLPPSITLMTVSGVASESWLAGWRRQQQSVGWERKRNQDHLLPVWA